MTNNGSLVNLGDISKPATVLVEKVCNAIGILYEPIRITRKAQAEADSSKISLLSQIDLEDIEHRALARLVHQEARKQQNIEDITSQAAHMLPPSADASKLDEDWIVHFFKQCDSISDTEMQSLWARLLVGEATEPGRFSKRTVDFVSKFDKVDAVLFTKFCQFVWSLGDLFPLIYDMNHEIYARQGIGFDAMKHLDSIGLISFEPLYEYKKLGLEKQACFSYYDRNMSIEFSQQKGNQLGIGHALLTKTGQELMPICGSEMNQEFFDYIADTWFRRELMVFCPHKI